MTYAEYLKSEGASDEDIKVLDTAIGRRAFDKMQSESTEAKASADRAQKEKEAYEAKVEKWHAETIAPEYERMKNEALAAKGREAAARAILEQAQKDGLLDVAKTMGWDKVDDKKDDKRVDFDASKFLTHEQAVALAEKEGEAIAMVADMVAEHQQLFPGKRLNVKQLREEAKGRKISVEQLWIEKYKVNDARDAQVKAEQDAHDKKIADEAYARAQSEMASKYGNPDARPLTPSRSPFTKKSDSGENKAPWEVGDRTNDRVSRATQSVIKQFSN